MSTNVSTVARVSPKARLGRNVTIGDFSVVGDDVEIGDDTTVESHCVVGAPSRTGGNLVVGARSHVRAHTVLYLGSTLGDELVTGNFAVIRERSTLGRGVQIGAYTELQGDVNVGDYTRTQSNVFVPKHCRIGAYVWLLPYVCLTNDPQPPSDPADRGVVVEDFAVMAARSMALPGVTIGARSLVAAQSLVTRDVPPDTVVMGSPARVRGKTSDLKRPDGSPAYPWTRHFHRGYPPDVVREWSRQG